MKFAFDPDMRVSLVNQERLKLIGGIIDAFSVKGYRLTLRQLYYQLVSRNIIPNQEKEYAKLGSLLTKGRMMGEIDWDALEDRVRKPYLPYQAEDKATALRDIIRQYRLPRQRGQENYLELWVEKDAISQIMRRVTSHYQINLMVNRGYSSTSAMYDARQRIQRAEDEEKKNPIILYLGDHDPSGLDMIRDVWERLRGLWTAAEVVHIALTKEQIEKYDPPPNPAKVTDPRAGNYISEHGEVSWEVDALSPEVLEETIKEKIEERIDLDLFNEMLVEEEEDRKELEAIAEGLGD